MNYRQLFILSSCVFALTIPVFAGAQGSILNNPLGTNASIEGFIRNVIYFLLSLSGFIALLALVIGGTMLVLGGMRSEQDLKRGKEIIFWALVGLAVIGLSATIILTLGTFLGL